VGQLGGSLLSALLFTLQICKTASVTEMPWPVHPAAELFPLLNGAELTELVDDIRSNGLIEPVWLYDDPERGTVLLDGRNRVRACHLAGTAVDTRQYRGDDPIGFSIAQNLKRRHLTTGQKAAVAYAAEPLYAAEAERRRIEAVVDANRRRAHEPCEADLPHMDKLDADTFKTEQTADPQSSAPRFDKPPRAPQSRDQAAKSSGASGRAVAQYKRVAQHAPDLAEKVQSGAMALDRAERIIRDREAEERKVAQARAEAEAQPDPYTVDIRHGDFREVLADVDDASVHAIITDPPYPFEYLPLLADLAAWADKVLTPDGVLAVLIGQTHLPEVFRLLDGGRPYRWTCAYLTSGPGYVSHPRRVQSSWKPLLLYGGGPRVSDVLRSEGSDANAKALHRWGQDYSAFHTLIERLTERGQTVADPFMGAGTTLLAAHALGRHVIGCDVDAEAVRTSRERVA
jgi:hypothetical protein